MMSRRRRFAVTWRGPLGVARVLRQPPLPAGQLRAMVLAHLRAHPGLDFSPAEVARVLGRPGSRGAIINICKQLVRDGLAVRTQDRPQRFRAAI
ncbi:MarR family transcriptional regulator [Virgisporangium aurantiacum]|uniref:Uncharacterized protein n=1 Tax=Virgisporangium aurantiacum TaxID=175570 RepID=A0A8J3ZFD0_9ACTN|nr:MarR family transcriptional regulator [Virgisporangium aurantiacum]GIJ63124.1 hypothetical protein Vau01_106400 [Virgisporangium aurantiacum]